MKNKLPIFLNVVAFAAALFHSGTAQAVNATWLGNSDANWANSANWSSAPSSNSLYFGAAGSSGMALTNNLPANTNIAGIWFNAGAAAFTITGITGNKINLTSGITNNSTSLQTINTDLNVNVTSFTLTSGGGNLVLGGNISGSGMQMQGTGFLTLSGSNTLGGNVSFSNSTVTLNINHPSALGSGTLGATASAGSFDNTSGLSITLANANNINIKVTTAVQFVGSNPLGFGHNQVLFDTGTRTLQVNGSTLTIGSLAPTSTTALFTKTGVGTLAILDAAGANFQSAFTLNGGTVVLGDKSAMGTGTFTATTGALQASSNLIGTSKIANAIALTALTVNGANSIEFGGKLTGATGNNRTLTSSLTSGTLILNDIDINTETASARTLTFAGTGNTTVNGVIANGNGTTANGLTITSTGTTTLVGSNTYTGLTGIQNGALSINSVGDVSATSALGAPTTAANGLIKIGSTSNTGTLIYTGGTGSTNRQIQVGANNGTGPSVLDTGGAVIQADGSGPLTFTNSVFNSINSGVIAGSARVLTLQGANVGLNTIAGIIRDNAVGGSGTGAVALVKAGAGTWVLSGTNTYSGTTNIKAGTLIVSGSLSGSSAVTVGDSIYPLTLAELAGSGTVGNVTVGAAPGNTGATVNPSNDVTEAVGTSTRLTTGSFTLASSGSATLALQVGRTSAGADKANDSSDRILATSLSLGSTGNLRLALQTSYTPVLNDVLYLIVNSGGTAGAFATVNNAAIDASNQFALDGETWQISYAANAGSGIFSSGGSDVAIQLVAIPEPSTWMMLTGGLGLLGVWQRSRRSRLPII